MPKESPAQKKTMERVMHEYKHNELKSGQGGKGGKVKSRRQATAIGMKEAGASKNESKSENKRNLKHTKQKEKFGRTAMQEKEGQKKKGRSAMKSKARTTSGKSKSRK